VGGRTIGAFGATENAADHETDCDSHRQPEAHLPEDDACRGAEARTKRNT